jgi:hypothetical protein
VLRVALSALGAGGRARCRMGSRGGRRALAALREFRDRRLSTAELLGWYPTMTDDERVSGAMVFTLAPSLHSGIVRGA